MFVIKIDPTNDQYAYINGELYIKASGKKDRDVFSIFNFESPKELWVSLSATQIFEIINNRSPKNKSEITQFAVSNLNHEFIEKGRSAKGRYYVMPPTFEL